MEEHKNYSEFIDRLKAVEVPLDDRMTYSRIEARINRRPHRANLVLAGALALLFFCFTVYYIGRPYFNGGSITLAEYVFQQNDSNTDPIMDYVLADR